MRRRSVKLLRCRFGFPALSVFLYCASEGSGLCYRWRDQMSPIHRRLDLRARVSIIVAGTFCLALTKPGEICSQAVSFCRALFESVRPNKTKAGNKYEVKPQYEELSKQINMQHAINQCYECMRLSKEIGQLGQCINRQIISCRLYTTVSRTKLRKTDLTLPAKPRASLNDNVWQKQIPAFNSTHKAKRHRFTKTDPSANVALACNSKTTAYRHQISALKLKQLSALKHAQMHKTTLHRQNRSLAKSNSSHARATSDVNASR
ncbi:hypothetical protein F511_27314 [Dorcoceras hygrometricum]|uniref:Uncharacterized protein n=1 Tax=Dorcoceras hygrometricum TaxID=472368 RepID=A0A2Z7DE11_9LAMI|nr:hypothetical protein F511_27314 [Dorcoceras hygrometricum]